MSSRHIARSPRPGSQLEADGREQDPGCHRQGWRRWGRWGRRRRFPSVHWCL